MTALEIKIIAQRSLVRRLNNKTHEARKELIELVQQYEKEKEDNTDIST